MKSDAILSIRVPKCVDEALKRAAIRMDLSKNDVARHALRAALDSLENSEYRVEWPFQFIAANSISPETKRTLTRLQKMIIEGRERRRINEPIMKEKNAFYDRVIRSAKRAIERRKKATAISSS